MALISFALTTKEFLSGRKTVTRRAWKDKYRGKWIKWYNSGKVIHDACDKVLYAGGKRIGKFELTCAPYLEKLSNMPLSDLKAEGGMCKTREEFCELIGKTMDDYVTVIRFKKLKEGSDHMAVGC